MSYSDTRQRVAVRARKAKKDGLPDWAYQHAAATIERADYRIDTIRKDWKSGKINRTNYDNVYSRATNELLALNDFLQAFFNRNLKPLKEPKI